MNIPQIRIESQMAKIGIEQTKPIQEIEQPPADLSIRQPKAELTIEQKLAKLTIDQTKAWEDMDIKSIVRRNEEFAELGREAALEATGRISREGDELMRIENHDNPIVRHAIENSEKPQFEFNVGWIPSAFSVKIDYIPAELNIRVQPKKPIIEATPNKPIHRYTPGKVHIYMLQYPSLKISFVDTKV